MSRRARRPAATAGTLPLTSAMPDGHAPALTPTGRPLALAARIKRRRWRWHRFALFAVVTYCGWIGQGQWRTYERVQARQQALQLELAHLRREHARLQAAVSYAQTPAYIKAAANQEFGMVAPNEVPVAPLPPGGRARG